MRKLNLTRAWKKFEPYSKPVAVITLIVSAIVFLIDLKSDLAFFRENFPKLATSEQVEEIRETIRADMRRDHGQQRIDGMKYFREGFLQIVEELDGIDGVDLTNVRSRLERLYQRIMEDIDGSQPIVQLRAIPGSGFAPEIEQRREETEGSALTLDVVVRNGSEHLVGRLKDGRYTEMGQFAEE